jgi:hypothetical protein
MIFFILFANATKSGGWKRKMAKMAGGGVARIAIQHSTLNIEGRGDGGARSAAGVSGQGSGVRNKNIQHSTLNVEGRTRIARIGTNFLTTDGHRPQGI